MALVLAAEATGGKWPRRFRCVFIVGSSALLWAAMICGLSLMLG
jgi:hypothetical protein